MKIHPYKCDGCGKLKGETNQWWIIRIARADGLIGLYRWGQISADTAGVKHICSQACVIHAMSAWMGEQ